MLIDNVPGLTIHEHEGRLVGTFELPAADLAAIRFDGRVLLAVVVDVGAPFRVTTTKDGTNLAHWTFKSVEAAIVRDESMRQHLASALHMMEVDSVDPHPLDSDDQLALESPNGGSWHLDEDALSARTITEEFEKDFEEAEAEREHMFAAPRAAVTALLNKPGDGPTPPREDVQRFGGPVKHDEALDRFLYDER